ncbi:hypothetical protein NKOR_06220 [Candidatus Nitrosopumilus koreensis AR1]|uniref:Uncharacterized protein n=1 Tax=Candidatus Nitrosopumilus koreensis AR1 TaxID=1229908 RepID=K0B832_9ARCH|nr:MULTISPECIES: hypothetical protein [Nitrosopumilus]AFS81125.1 hypothetical protein NKOR_06220 [Candidatus Nitrosopumilus koreensis AR1]
MKYFLILSFVAILFMPQAFAESSFNGNSSIDPPLSEVVAGKSTEMTIRFLYTSGPYTMNDFSPVIEVNPSSARQFVQVDVDSIEITQGQIKRIPVTLTVDPQIEHNKIFLSISYVGHHFQTDELQKSSWNDQVALDVLVQDSTDSEKYRFIDFSYAHMVGEPIQFILEKTADADCNSYDAKIIDEEGNFVLGWGAEISCSPDLTSSSIPIQTKIGYNEDRPIIINDSGKYYLEIDFDDVHISKEFVVRQNPSGMSLDRTVYPVPWSMSPLKQFKSGVPSDEIQCRDSLTLVTKNNGTPACVKEHTLLKLVERNLIITSKAERDLMLDAGYKLYPGVGWVKDTQENRITREPPSEYPNSCPPWKFYNETEKNCKVVLPCPDNMFLSDVSQECEFKRTLPPEPEPIDTDQQTLLDARDKLREAYHANVSWGSFNIKDVIVGYGIGDGFLIVDILEKYYDSDRKLIEQKIIDITGGDVDIEFNSSDAIIPTSMESVFPYVWNGFLHRNGVEFTPKEQSYANNDIGYDGVHRVCSPIIASNGTELYVSSVFVYEPFEITGTYIDKIQPDDCYKIWKTDTILVEPDLELGLWLENYWKDEN